jgi:hypothetical protein
MRGRMGILLLLLGTLALGLNSCGGGGGGGIGSISSDSGGTFKAATILIDSDVAVWTGTPCGATSTYTVLPDDDTVTFTAFSAPAGSTGNTPEQVVIDNVTIAFTPATVGSPALQTQYQAIGQQVALGGSVTFPVRVASQKLKSDPPLNSLVCTPTIYGYRATMLFNCHYLVSGNTFQGSTQINITFADFGN